MTPERTHGWLGVLLPVLERGGPVLSLLILCIGSLAIWWLLDDIRRLQGITRELAERLLTSEKTHAEQMIAAKQAQVDLALKCYAPTP
jgi:hypothetical protein